MRVYVSSVKSDDISFCIPRIISTKGTKIIEKMIKIMMKAEKDFRLVIISKYLYIGLNKYAKTQAVAIAGRNTVIMI